VCIVGLSRRNGRGEVLAGSVGYTTGAFAACWRVFRAFRAAALRFRVFAAFLARAFVLRIRFAFAAALLRALDVGTAIARTLPSRFR
jgi:hypothetical protein